MTDDYADVLDAAADLIERDGWWAGDGPADLGHTCAALAIGRALTDPYNAVHPIFGILADHVDASDRSAYDRVTDWNDAQESGDKVIYTLRTVAADLRASAAP